MLRVLTQPGSKADFHDSHKVSPLCVAKRTLAFPEQRLSFPVFSLFITEFEQRRVRSRLRPPPLFLTRTHSQTMNRPKPRGCGGLGGICFVQRRRKRDEMAGNIEKSLETPFRIQTMGWK